MKRIFFIILFILAIFTFANPGYASQMADHNVSANLDAGISVLETPGQIQIDFRVTNAGSNDIESYKMVIGIYYLDGTKGTHEVTGPDTDVMEPKQSERGAIYKKTEKEIKFIKIESLESTIKEKQKVKLKEILIPQYIRDIKFTPVTISIMVMVLLALLTGFSGG